MKFLLPICLFLISIPSTVAAHASLTRAQTREAEQRLSEMGYWTGTVDGLFDTATRSALVAFQKWEGRAVTGELTLDELEAIRTSAAPKAREPGYEHVEVDLDRQVLLLINDEGGVRVLSVSTGSGKSSLRKDRPAYRTHRAAGSLFMKKRAAGRMVRSDPRITPISLVAAWQFTAAAMFQTNPRVMVVFAYQCLRLVK